jgi:hypothetical protein
MNYSRDETDDKECKCSRCADSGIVYVYNRDGDAFNMPCPNCTEDEMSHIRRWDGQVFDG